MKLRRYSALFASVFFAAAPHAATFSDVDVNLVGSAYLDGGNLLLNGPSSGWSSGAAWATMALNTGQSFSTTFSYTLSNSGARPMADGIAFSFQSIGTQALQGGGGNVGYGGLNGPGWILQTWVNNQVGFARSIGDAYSAPRFSADLGNADSVIGTTTISYDPSTHNLVATGSLLVNGTTAYATNDQFTFDLSSLGPTVTYGITGGTGGSYADQRITQWSASVVPEADTLALALTGMGVAGLATARQRRPRG